MWPSSASLGCHRVTRTSFFPALLTGEAMLEAPELLPGFAIPAKEVFEL
jgi:hypothetical protein